MFSIVLCMFALLLNNGMIVISHRIDDVTIKFIADAIPILFPPSRISLHSCITYDNTIKLSRKLSSLHLTHVIHNNIIPEFDRRIYDDLEHHNLYVLDMDCNYTVEILRLVNLNRMFVAPMRWLLLKDQRTFNDNDDNVNLTVTYDNSISAIFENFAIYPDSDVVLAKRLDGDFVQLTSVYRPSPQRGVIWEDRGNWTIENSLRMKTFDVASVRRRNLQQTTLKTAIVILDAESLNHLDDFEATDKDPYTRANYNWVRHITNQMNATLNVSIADNWGRITENGSIDGMCGMIIKHEVDIGGTNMYMLEDAINEVKYVNLHTNFGVKFVFRQPLLSTMKNIYILPFDKSIWIAIAVFLLVVFCSLYASMKWDYYRNTMKNSAPSWKDTLIGKPTLGEGFLVLLGAVAQQGYSYEPYRFSPRIITLMLLLASLSLYAAYTANIVALLQSPADSIKTLSDLLQSPLTLGAHDRVYAHYIFENMKDPVRKAIFHEKIEPKGRKSNWMEIAEGVRRIRNESFAFHGAESTMYQIMQKTYEENEKCGLTDIDYLKVRQPHLTLPKQSPYLEIIKNGAMKLRESGLKFRDEYRLFTRKPKCSNQANFLNVGFTECRFVIIIMGYGILLSLTVFVLELLWHKIRKMSTIKQTIPIVKENEDIEMFEYVE